MRSTPRPGHLTPGKETRYPFDRRLGGPQGRSEWMRKISPPLGFDPPAVRSAASRYTVWAIAAHRIRPTSVQLQCLSDWITVHFLMRCGKVENELSILKWMQCKPLSIPSRTPWKIEAQGTKNLLTLSVMKIIKSHERRRLTSKPNERVVKCSWVMFKLKEMKCRQV